MAALCCLIADESPIFRAGLASVLRSENAEIVPELASTPQEAVRRAGAHAPNVMVLGFEELADVLEITSALPDLPIMVMTQAPQLSALRVMIRKGVRAVIGKDSEIDEILQTLVLITRGSVVLDPRCARALARTEDGADGSHTLKSETALTDREEEIVRLVTQGLSNKEIATKLQIAGQTVRNHVHNIMTKLGVGSRTELWAGIWSENWSGRSSLGPPPLEQCAIRARRKPPSSRLPKKKVRDPVTGPAAR